MVDEKTPLLKGKADDPGAKGTQTLTSGSARSAARANNKFVLWCTVGIVSIVTIALAVAAVLSRSLALTADVVQNGVDLSTYIVNLYAEYEAEKLEAAGVSAVRGKRLELFAACFSVAGLVAVGTYVLYAAIGRFHEAAKLDSPNHASPGIDSHVLLAFTIVGCVADIATLTLFMRYAQAQRVVDNTLEGAAGEKNVNMVSASAHVVTDAIRSVTIVTGAFLIYLQHHKVIQLPVSEDVMDGYLSCFVVACMAGAVVFVLKEIVELLQNSSREAGGLAPFICKPGDLPVSDMLHEESDSAKDIEQPSRADGMRRRNGDGGGDKTRTHMSNTEGDAI